MACLITVGAAAGPASAADEPAKLQADQVTLHDQVMTADGHAHLTYKDLSIDADHLYVDMQENTLQASGHVSVTEGGETIRGEEFRYDLDLEQGSLGPFQSEFTGDGIKGSIYLSGDRLSSSKDEISASNLSLTTCPLPYPHYHFTAGRVEYYPGDRLILRQVFYWEGHLRLLYLPYLAISLRERTNSFSFPELGYSAQDGLFLKLSYNFFVGDTQSGSVLLDLMERTGIGEGLRYTWELPGDAEISALAYHLGNYATGGDQYQLQTDLTVPWKSTKLKASLAYIDGSVPGGAGTTSYTLDASLTPTSGTGPQLALDYKTSITSGQQNSNLNLVFSGNWHPWEDSLLTLTGRFYWVDNSLTGETLQQYYDSRFMQSWQWGRFTAALLNQEGPGYTTSILPELTLEVPSFDAGSILGKYRLVLDYQHAERYSTSGTIEGDRGALDLTRERWSIGKAGPFQLQGWIWARGRIYGDGSILWAAAPELALVTKLGTSLRLETGFSWIAADGTPPSIFSGDTVYPGGNLNLSASYSLGRWRAGLATSYSLAAENWQPISANLSWSSPGGDRLSLSTSYNMQSGLFGLTTASLSWRPRKDWSFLLTAGYNPQTDDWTRLDFVSSLSQPIGDYLTLGLATRYDFYVGGWTQTMVKLAYDYCCRTFTLGYDWMQGEVSLTVALNAFPQESLGFGASGSGLWLSLPDLMP